MRGSGLRLTLSESLRRSRGSSRWSRWIMWSVGFRRAQGFGCRGAEGWVTGNRATGSWKQGGSLKAKNKAKLDLFETGTKKREKILKAVCTSRSHTQRSADEIIWQHEDQGFSADTDCQSDVCLSSSLWRETCPSLSVQLCKHNNHKKQNTKNTNSTQKHDGLWQEWSNRKRTDWKGGLFYVLWLWLVVLWIFLADPYSKQSGYDQNNR